ncbi:hypothetical protein [Planctomicrobium sp. SH664]|uniref:hypothetical protein n=1 Tax=Planctomicrobium sp. SH664 TaxID=3448125 RepID=UPI003F5B6C54
MRPVFAAVVVCLGVCSQLPAMEEQGALTVAQAAKVINLSTWKVKGLTLPESGQVAQLHCELRGSPTTVFKAIQEQLVAEKWEELPQSYVNEQSVSATFAKEGFLLSVSLYPATKENSVTLTITNHGNVNVAKLPVPQEATPLYTSGTSAMFLTPGAPEEVAKILRVLILSNRGWEPYGEAGDVAWYKRGAQRISVRCTAAPAHAGKTIIDFSGTLLSADLPAPPEASKLQYSDSRTQLAADTPLSTAELATHYRAALKTSGWEATTDKPFQSSIYEEMIFRNPANEMLTLKMSTVEGKTRMLLRFQTAREVAEEMRIAQEKVAASKAKSETALPKYILPLPQGAHSVNHKPTHIEFQLKSGTALAELANLRKTLEKDGWKAAEVQAEANFGTAEFSRDDQKLLIVYLDPGIIPAEFTVTSHGFTLEKEAN